MKGNCRWHRATYRITNAQKYCRSPRERTTAYCGLGCRPLRGLNRVFNSDPGAGAPGFMLPPASRAQSRFNSDPGAGAPGFMLPPASRAQSRFNSDPGAGAPGFMLSPASRAQSRFNSDPGAGAPGFMLPPASRAQSRFNSDPGAGAPGFMLSPASRAQSRFNSDPGAGAPGSMLSPASRARRSKSAWRARRSNVTFVVCDTIDFEKIDELIPKRHLPVMLFLVRQVPLYVFQV
jgi:hypothetical protein